MIKVIRVFSSVLVFFSIIFLGYCYFTGQGIFSARTKNTISTKTIDIGGHFSLTNHNGNLVHTSDFTNKYMLVFFGFSSCKRICPMHLGIISEALTKLDQKLNEKLQVLFVTVDPKRDSVEKLRDFQQQFDSRIIMLTGDKDEIDKIALKYKVYVSNTANNEEINHSSIIYLISPNGEYVTHFSLDIDSSEDQAQKLSEGIEHYLR
ncbi:SCO family protein [Wolbachia endosymbiont of Pentidionis agamae]|uniref:SCO family protein n=1 Tax=Wolbachia endosymbiont of Pentidionis agamae TaxID=3110435 RepID=UPI002FD73FA0